jgi:hypothetical protein
MLKARSPLRAVRGLGESPSLLPVGLSRRLPPLLEGTATPGSPTK